MLSRISRVEGKRKTAGMIPTMTRRTWTKTDLVRPPESFCKQK
jgi:hypothetical protein